MVLFTYSFLCLITPMHFSILYVYMYVCGGQKVTYRVLNTVVRPAEPCHQPDVVQLHRFLYEKNLMEFRFEQTEWWVLGWGEVVSVQDISADPLGSDLSTSQ